MATKIRLQRHGKKRAAFYHVVIADERAKRDGKFIEKIGTYNPNTDPATIDLKFDRALHWVKIGAQPTDTARAILSYKGVMLKKHLNGGVAKGAFSEEEAEKRFNAWLQEKEAKIQAKRDGLAKDQADAKAKIFEAEKAINESRVAVAEPEVEEAEEATATNEEE